MSVGVMQAGAALTADGQVIAGRAALCGFSVREVGGGVATGIIRNGTSVAGNPVAYINLAAAASDTVVFHEGVACPNGIFFDEVTGAIDIIVYYQN